ncbi:hypothetical protein BBJ28_00018978 [Nothophytophthora sp. Chile5]|nr:hypothetical protein BBJ28_00018978 [Nothophytophthora sp. Chile5]
MSAATGRSATSSGADRTPPPPAAPRPGPGVASNGGPGLAAVPKDLGKSSAASPSPRRSLSSPGRRRRMEGGNMDASDTETEADEELSAALTAAGRWDVGASETGGPRRLERARSADTAMSEDDVPLSTFRAFKRRKMRTNATGSGPRPQRPAPSQDLGGQEEAVSSTEWEMLELETRRLAFEVAQWKQQQALRRETLELKSEEIRCKEEVTRQQHEVQTMEVRARVVQALGEVGKTAAQAREYLDLLEH